MTHFGVVLVHNSPKYGPILLKFLPEAVLKDAKSVFEESLKYPNFDRNERLDFEPNLPSEDGRNHGK